MSAWAKPGVKVECILGGPLPESAKTAHPFWEPVVGEVYTIFAVEVVDGHLGVYLEEQLEFDWVYALRRFRPLIACSQEQDLELFLSLLNTVEEPA